MPPQPDRALRRAVGDLARLHPDDAAAVLDELAPRERKAVEALLRAWRGEPVSPQAAGEAAAEPTPPPAWEGVSPWLVARLDPAADTARGPKAPAITPTARAALRAAAEPFRAARPAGARPPGRSLFGRLWQLVSPGTTSCL